MNGWLATETGPVYWVSDKQMTAVQEIEDAACTGWWNGAVKMPDTWRVPCSQGSWVRLVGE